MKEIIFICSLEFFYKVLILFLYIFFQLTVNENNLIDLDSIFY